MRVLSLAGTEFAETRPSRPALVVEPKTRFPAFDVSFGVDMAVGGGKGGGRAAAVCAFADRKDGSLRFVDDPYQGTEASDEMRRKVAELLSAFLSKPERIENAWVFKAPSRRDEV